MAGPAVSTKSQPDLMVAAKGLNYIQQPVPVRYRVQGRLLVSTLCFPPCRHWLGPMRWMPGRQKRLDRGQKGASHQGSWW
jgi:hypothetical protein